MQEQLKIQRFAKQQDQSSVFQKRQELMHGISKKQLQKGEAEQLHVGANVTQIDPYLVQLVELHQEHHSLKNFW